MYMWRSSKLNSLKVYEVVKEADEFVALDPDLYC